MRLACLAAFGNVPVGADAPWPSGTESSHGARLEVTILTLNSVCRWPARTVDLRGKQKCVFFFGTQKRAVCSKGNCLPLLEHFSVLTSVKPARRPALLSALDDARSTLSGPELREFDLAQMQAGLTRRSKPSALSENNHQSPSTLPVSSGAAVGPSGWGEPEDAVRNPAAQVYRSPESDREQLRLKLEKKRNARSPTLSPQSPYAGVAAAGNSSPELVFDFAAAEDFLSSEETGKVLTTLSIICSFCSF